MADTGDEIDALRDCDLVWKLGLGEREADFRLAGNDFVSVRRVRISITRVDVPDRTTKLALDGFLKARKVRRGQKRTYCKFVGYFCWCDRRVWEVTAFNVFTRFCHRTNTFVDY